VIDAFFEQLHIVINSVFIYGLFIDTVSSSVSNDMIINKEWIGDDREVSEICLAGLTETTRT
jgi:hypothetical protein